MLRYGTPAFCTALLLLAYAIIDAISAHSDAHLETPAITYLVSHKETACFEQNLVYLSIQKVRINQEHLWKPDHLSCRSKPVEIPEKNFNELCQKPKDRDSDSWADINVDLVDDVRSISEKSIPLSEYAAIEEEVERSRKCLEFGYQASDSDTKGIILKSRTLFHTGTRLLISGCCTLSRGIRTTRSNRIHLAKKSRNVSN